MLTPPWGVPANVAEMGIVGSPRRNKNRDRTIAAFITPRLNVNLPEGLSLPTMPTDILCGILLLAGVFWNVFYDVNK